MAPAGQWAGGCSLWMIAILHVPEIVVPCERHLNLSLLRFEAASFLIQSRDTTWPRAFLRTTILRKITNDRSVAEANSAWSQLAFEACPPRLS